MEPRGLDWRTVKTDYCRGLSEYEREPGYLRGTALTGQDYVKGLLDAFRIDYDGSA